MDRQHISTKNPTTSGAARARTKVAKPRLFLAGILSVGIIAVAYAAGWHNGYNSAPPLIKAEAAPVRIGPSASSTRRSQEALVLNLLEDDDKSKQPTYGDTSTTDSQSANNRQKINRVAPSATNAKISTTKKPAAILTSKAKSNISRQGDKPMTIAKKLTPITAVPPPSDASGKKIAAKDSNKKIGVKAKPPKPKKAAKTKSQGRIKSAYYIQLGSFRSKETAVAVWLDMRTKYADILAGLKSRIEKKDIPRSGLFFRLQAGPLKTHSTARALCNKISQAGQACIPIISNNPS